MSGPEDITADEITFSEVQQALGLDISALVLQSMPDEEAAAIIENVPENLIFTSDAERREIADIQTSIGKWRKVQAQKAARQKKEEAKQAEEKALRFDGTSRWERVLKLRYGLNTQVAVDTYKLAKDPLTLSMELQALEKTLSEEVVVTARDINKIFPARYIELLGPNFFINNIRKVILSPQSLILMHILQKKNLEAFHVYFKDGGVNQQINDRINNFVAATIRRVERIQHDHRDVDIAANQRMLLQEIQENPQLALAQLQQHNPEQEVDNENENLRSVIPEKLRKFMFLSSPYERAHRMQVLEWLQTPSTREKLQRDLSLSQGIAFQEYVLTHLNMHLPEDLSLLIQMKRSLRGLPLSSKSFMFRFTHHMKKPFWGMLALWITAILLIVLLSVTGIITPVLSLLLDSIRTLFSSLFWSSVILGIVGGLRANIFENYNTVDTIARTQIEQSDALRRAPGCSLEDQIRCLEIKIKYLRLLRDSYEKKKGMYDNKRFMCLLHFYSYALLLLIVLSDPVQTAFLMMGILILVGSSPVSTLITIMVVLIPLMWSIYKTYQLWHRATLVQAELSAATEEEAALRQQARAQAQNVLAVAPASAADEKAVPQVVSLFWHPEEKEVAPKHLQKEEAEQYRKSLLTKVDREEKESKEEGLSLEADLPKVSATPQPAEELQVRDYGVPTKNWRPTWNATPMIRAFHFFNHYSHLVRLRSWKKNNPDAVEFYYPQPSRDGFGREVRFTAEEKAEHRERQKILKRCLFSISRGEEQLEKFRMKTLLFKHAHQNLSSEEDQGDVRRFIKQHLSQEEKSSDRTVDLLCRIFIGQKLPHFKNDALFFLQAFLAQSSVLGTKITYKEIEKINRVIQVKMQGRSEVTQIVFFEVLGDSLKEYFGMQLPCYLKKYRADLERGQRTVFLTKNVERVKKTTWTYEREEKDEISGRIKIVTVVEDLNTRVSRIEKEKKAEFEKMIQDISARWSNRFTQKMSMEDLFHAFYEENLSYKRLPEEFFPEKISYKSLLCKFLKLKNYIKEIPQKMDNHIPREYQELKEKMVSVMEQLRKLHQEELRSDPLFEACFSDDVSVAAEEFPSTLTIA